VSYHTTVIIFYSNMSSVLSNMISPFMNHTKWSQSSQKSQNRTDLSSQNL